MLVKPGMTPIQRGPQCLMGYTVTSSSRQVVMAVLLTLATAGGVIRYFAPNPSVLRDVGTLLLVLWLPAVGNLVAFFIRKIPRKPPPATDFAPGAAFRPQLQVRVDALPLPDALEEHERRCTLLVGRQGFTVRFAQPVRQALAQAGAQVLPLELLHPKAGLPKLKDGMEFHLLAGTTAIAKGRITEVAR